MPCSGCNYDESYVEDNINADDDDDDHESTMMIDDNGWTQPKWINLYNNQTDKLILMKMAKSYNKY